MLLKYNLQDVIITEAIYGECKGREEKEVVRVHETINARGIYIDVKWLKDLLGVWDAIETEGGDEIRALTDGALTRETVDSPHKVKQWLLSQGLRIKSIARAELDAMYADPEGYFAGASENFEKVGGINVTLIAEVLRLRLQLTRAMKGKLEKIAESLHADHRVRDWAVYNGAHTGRFTARGLQPHNLSKGVLGADKIDGTDFVEAVINGPRTVEHIREVARRLKVSADDILVSFVRPVFAAPEGSDLGIADWNAIEARAAAWLFNEKWMLECFADPKRDIYCEYWERVTGEKINKKSPFRQIAKICVLGLQYGMGANKLGVFAKKSGVDLEALGLTAEKLKNDYRANCPAIKAGWGEIDEALREAVHSGYSVCCSGRIRFSKFNSDNLHCTLPSGRTVIYRSCQYRRGVPGYCALLGLAPFETDILSYRSQRGGETDLFGAKATENISQGLCADVLKESLVTLEDNGFAPVLHVHDEIACERGKIEEQCRLMSIPPSWAPDLPLRVEGFTGSHYVKTAWSGSEKCDYMMGRKL